MDAERLKALTERSERATGIAKQIKELQAIYLCDPTTKLRIWNSYTTHDLLPASVIEDVFALGRAVKVADLEKQLEELLGIVPVKSESELPDFYEEVRMVNQE